MELISWLSSVIGTARLKESRVNLIRKEVSLSVKTVFHSQNVKRRQNDAYLWTAIIMEQSVRFLLQLLSGRQHRPERRKGEDSDPLGLLGKEIEGPTLVGANHHHINYRPH